jgi:hypothetical protein
MQHCVDEGEAVIGGSRLEGLEHQLAPHRGTVDTLRGGFGRRLAAAPVIGCPREGQMRALEPSVDAREP